MKNKTITISESQEKFLLENFKNVNQGIQECINKAMQPDEAAEKLRLIRAYSKQELKGIFSKHEWYFFFDSLNGTMTTGLFRCNASALIAHCEDAQTYEQTATKYNVMIEDLTTKISRLTGSQVEALYAFVDDFWNNDERNLEKSSIELI